MDLSILIILPLITLLGILLVKGLKQVRTIALLGSAIQLVLCFILLYLYQHERSMGNTANFIFESGYVWYEPLHINYHVGVDGISIAMILLTAFVVIAGVLVSWRVEKLSKEFFFLLILLFFLCTKRW